MGHSSQFGPRKSGCKMSKYTPTNKELSKNVGLEMKIWNAWLIADGCLIKVKATTTHKSFLGDHSKNYAGSIKVEVINQTNGSKSDYWGVLDLKTDKVRIPDLNWVLNPNAPNGGYAGKSGKPKQNNYKPRH